MLHRAWLPAAMAVFVLVAIGWPIARLYARTGVFAIVMHRDPATWFVGFEFALSQVGILLFTVAYAVLGPAPLGVWLDHLAAHAAGGALGALGFGLVVLAQAQMGASWRIGIDARPTALVTDGLFAWTRNPIYLGVNLCALGLMIAVPCPWTVMLFVHVAALLGIQARLEEAHLLALHGDVYRAYAARVGRLVPGFGRLG